MRKNDSNRLADWPVHLRGEAQNKWGGHKVQKLRAYRGNTYGPASECRTLTAEQKEAWAKANGYSC